MTNNNLYSDVVGQKKAKTLLNTLAVARGSILLIAHPGYGKTHLAVRYLSQFGQVLSLTGPTMTIDRILDHNGPVFIDEAHKLAETPEALYPLIDSGQRVFAFATTHEGQLPKALLSRLHTVALEKYTPEELAAIAKMVAKDLPGAITSDALLAIGNLSSSPRMAIKLTLLLGYYVVPNSSVALDLLRSFGYPEGYTERQLDLLRLLRHGKKSLSVLSGTMGTDSATIKVIESDLVSLNLIAVTSGGRELTSKGRDLLKRLEENK